MIGRVNVRISGQPGKIFVIVDTSVRFDTEIYVLDDCTCDRVFKQAHATLCDVVSDSGGTPHIHNVSYTNATTPIMVIDILTMCQPILYYGGHLELVDEPLNHKQNAKRMCCGATVNCHSM